MFGAKSREIAGLQAHINDLNEESNKLTNQIESLQYDLRASTDDRDGWLADYRSLNDRYTLLDSLLKQLRINVTLPVKVARQGK